MKIAVCMSGHFRLAHYCSRQNKWFYDLLKDSGNDVDVFLHTWSDKKKVLLDDHLYKFTHIHMDRNIPDTPNWWGQWISFSRCMDLVKNYNKDYDVVIRVRSDNLIFPCHDSQNINKLLEDVKKNKSLFTDSIWGRNDVLYIQDQLFLGHYDIFTQMFDIDNVMSVVSRSKKDKKVNPVSTIGYLMEHFDFKNIRVQANTYIDFFNQKLCRPPHLEVDYKSLKYSEARQIYLDYKPQRQFLKDNMPQKTYKDWIE